MILLEGAKDRIHKPNVYGWCINNYKPLDFVYTWNNLVFPFYVFVSKLAKPKHRFCNLISPPSIIVSDLAAIVHCLRSHRIVFSLSNLFSTLPFVSLVRFLLQSQSSVLLLSTATRHPLRSS